MAILESYMLKLTPMDNQFNDFMELRSMLQEDPSDQTGNSAQTFQLYLQGEKLLKQHKLSEAEVVIREIFCQLQQRKDHNDALQWLISSDDGDKGLVLAGELAEFLNHDLKSAVTYYEQLLQDHPNSIFSEPVRLRVRQLKTDLES